MRNRAIPTIFAKFFLHHQERINPEAVPGAPTRIWRPSRPRGAERGSQKLSLYSRSSRERGGERATRRAQAASVHVACAASCSLPFELPLCPLRGTPPALRVWSPLPSALLFWMPRSEKACLAAARKDHSPAVCLKRVKSAYLRRGARRGAGGSGPF